MPRPVHILVGLPVLAAVGYWLFADTVRYHMPKRFDEPAVRFSHWGDFRMYQMWAEIIAAFHEAHPDIRIHHEYVVGFRYETKIQQQIVSGDAPDVMLFQDEPFVTFAPRAFADLSEFVDDPNVGIDLRGDYLDTAVDSFLVDGRPYGIPFLGGNLLIVWNKRCFAAADRLHGRKIRRPFDGWTMDDFLEIARDVTVDEDGDGRIDHFGFMLPHWVYFLPIMWSHGVDVLDPTRSEWRLMGPAAERVFELYRKMRWEYRICPTPLEQSEMLTDTAFFTGRVAMCMNGPWLQPFLNATSMGPSDGKPPEYGIAHIPYGPGGERYTRITWDALCVFKDLSSERKRRAWTFIRFACGKTGQDSIAKWQQALPALRASLDTFRRQDNGSGAYRFVDALTYSRLQPITRHWYPMDRVLRSNIDLLRENAITGSEFVDRVVGDPALHRMFGFPTTNEPAPASASSKGAP